MVTNFILAFLEYTFSHMLHWEMGNLILLSVSIDFEYCMSWIRVQSIICQIATERHHVRPAHPEGPVTNHFILSIFIFRKTTFAIAQLCLSGFCFYQRVYSYSSKRTFVILATWQPRFWCFQYELLWFGSFTDSSRMRLTRRSPFFLL